jgi:hypothetical protein
MNASHADQVNHSFTALLLRFHLARTTVRWSGYIAHELIFNAVQLIALLSLISLIAS